MIVQDIKRAVDALANPGKPSAIKGPDTFVDRFTRDLDSRFYKTNRENWYKALPYGFKFRNRQGDEHIMFLPISPENLTITTHYATNVITTLYGTVEEHSEQRYFDILIEGTTGIMPKYPTAIPKASLGNLKNFSSTGRGSYGDATGFRLSIGSQIAGGFFSQTIGIANQILGKAQDVLNGKESMDVSGIDSASNTGYQAFHRLYKFFLEYKADASGIRRGAQPAMDRRQRSGEDDSSHPLSFLNYKDNQQYDVSIQRFTLKRDTSNPMLYKYSITLRAYNLREIGQQMGIGGLQDRLSALGLDGVESSTLLSQVSGTVRNVKQLAAAALGGRDILGR
jgi:hypothetical protein